MSECWNCAYPLGNDECPRCHAKIPPDVRRAALRAVVDELVAAQIAFVTRGPNWSEASLYAASVRLDAAWESARRLATKG
jgi:hypothetical protein